MISSAPADPEAEHVHQRIARVALVERNLAADRGNTDAVAVAGDPGDDARKSPADEGFIERAEPQRVQQGNRSGAHREDVADDAPDAGGRTLVGLDERGMVV